MISTSLFFRQHLEETNLLMSHFSFRPLGDLGPSNLELDNDYYYYYY